MQKLHIRLIQLIHSFGDTKTQLETQLVSKRLLSLQLTIITIGTPNDNVLFKYANTIITLNTWGNSNITDKGIEKLVNLRTLNADGNSGITDKGIEKLVNLRTLNAYGNLGITDKGIEKLVNLHTLYANGNPGNS